MSLWTLLPWLLLVLCTLTFWIQLCTWWQIFDTSFRWVCYCLFSHSLESLLLWSNRIVHSLCKTRWWSRWEVIHQMLELFGDIELWFGSTYTTKMLTVLQNPANWQIEIAAVFDAGKEFVKSTYKLKGDGALVLDCYECFTVSGCFNSCFQLS